MISATPTPLPRFLIYCGLHRCRRRRRQQQWRTGMETYMEQDGLQPSSTEWQPALQTRVRPRGRRHRGNWSAGCSCGTLHRLGPKYVPRSSRGTLVPVRTKTIVSASVFSMFCFLVNLFVSSFSWFFSIFLLSRESDEVLKPDRPLYPALLGPSHHHPPTSKPPRTTATSLNVKPPPSPLPFASAKRPTPYPATVKPLSPPDARLLPNVKPLRRLQRPLRTKLQAKSRAPPLVLRRPRASER